MKRVRMKPIQHLITTQEGRIIKNFCRTVKFSINLNRYKDDAIRLSFETC